MLREIFSPSAMIVGFLLGWFIWWRHKKRRVKSLRNEEARGEARRTGIKCEHFNWRIVGSEFIGYATCDDCGEKILVSLGINKLQERLRGLIAEIESRKGSGKNEAEA